MVLNIAQALADKYFPFDYAVHILVALVSLMVLRTFSQGRRTTRERDLHNRTFIVTGGFTPLGLVLLQSLASRGARLIVLSPKPIDSPTITILVSLLRTTYNNDNIFAEQCDLNNVEDIRKFCTRFLTEGEGTAEDNPANTTIDKRLDGIVFGHEYQHIGVLGFLRGKGRTSEQEQCERDSGALATFLMITLLLPALLVAPVERDIRIVNVVNPFYAAAAGSTAFNPTFALLSSSSPSTTPNQNPIFLAEGLRSLRTIILTRHLQRVLDALPKPQVPKTEERSSTVPVVSPKMQRSNIVAISVSPGISRMDTVSRMLNANWSSSKEGDAINHWTWSGVILYILLFPLLFVATKSPTYALQTVLHALFLPTPFKIVSAPPMDATEKSEDESDIKSDKKSSGFRTEVLKPGALYADCAVVQLKVNAPQDDRALPSDQKGANESKPKGKEPEGKNLREEVLRIEDDGEYGGETAGRMVWEAYEEALKAWERKAKVENNTTRPKEN